MYEHYFEGLGLTLEVVFNVYKYIHMYPKTRWAATIFQKSRNYIDRILIPALNKMSAVVDEITWDYRLNPWSHIEYFPNCVTGFTDSFPLYFQQPKNSTLRKGFYNAKYGGCIIKYLIIIDCLGRIIFFHGPWGGCSYDGHIFNATAILHPLKPWERLLGDGHFTVCPGVLSPYRKPLSTHNEATFNAVLSFYRSRVEHVIGYLKRHAMFSTPFRGNIGVLSKSMKLAAHTSNVRLKSHARYRPVGPWPHGPEP